MPIDKQRDFTEKQLESKLVYEGGLLRVCEDRILLPDGRQATREYIRHPGAVMVIALLDEETLILERQFRYPLQRHFYELPAGKIDPGEAPEATAKRELIEECGYEAGYWRHLATLHPCVGYSDEHIELFLARDLKYVGHAPDDGEFLEVVPAAIRETLDWVRSGKITDIKTVAGLLWLDRIARAGW
ncbi:MAG TPA: NUDIX hydrolase [Burkholderiales bacterium]|nr:NUDIX hydrolase [Burkholderiales bacterium]